MYTTVAQVGFIVFSFSTFLPFKAFPLQEAVEVHTLLVLSEWRPPQELMEKAAEKETPAFTQSLQNALNTRCIYHGEHLCVTDKTSHL